MGRAGLIVFTTIVLLIAAPFAAADMRAFTFSYETYPIGKGNWEFEQWFTWEQAGNDNVYRFREEVEIGLADNFTLGLYLPNWRYESTDERDGLDYESVGVEGILYLMNPATDAIGLGWYNEINIGEDELEFETKLLVQKVMGKWNLAYNLVLETELEHVFDSDEENEVEGVIENTFGASYSFGKGDFRAGGELVIESIYEDWEDYEHTVVYGGPVFSYVGGESWFVTVTPMIQLTDEDEEADFQVRAIAGYQF